MREQDILVRYEVDAASDSSVRELRRATQELALMIAHGLLDSVHRTKATDLLWDACQVAEKGLRQPGGEIVAPEAGATSSPVSAVLEGKVKADLVEVFSGLKKEHQVAALSAVAEELTLDDEV